MTKLHGFFTLAAAALIGTGAAACASTSQGAAAGSYIEPAEAANTVVLHVDNQSPQSMELRVSQNGRSFFVGSVSGGDTTSILLDPSLFPTATLYVAGIPADGRGRAVVGPLAAGKGQRINFSISPAYEQSQAFVVR